MSDPMFMNKEDVERLCAKSKRLSGAKWKWRRICQKHGLTWQVVEEKYDIIIANQEKALEKFRSTNKQLGNASPGVEREVPAAGDGSSTSSFVVTEYKDGKIKLEGEEVRPGETENGPATPKGTE